MQRGEVCIARFNPNQGAEIGKIRPVLILTENRLLAAGIPMVMVVPLSSQCWQGMEALRVEISPRDRLLKSSYVVIEQARSIGRARISDEVLAREQQDFTLAHRQLSRAQVSPFQPAEGQEWWQWYQHRLSSESRSAAERVQAMEAVNPLYVLRTWLAQLAIDAAQRGDFSLVSELRQLLAHPFLNKLVSKPTPSQHPIGLKG